MIAVISRLPLALSATLAVFCWTNSALAGEACCAPSLAVVEVTPVVYVEPAAPSWIFEPSTFTHDPETGARVAQYLRKPPIEPLDDQRAVTSRYRRTRTNVRGTDGSYETSYQVQAWGNGRGGLDAEWERFHDAWKESILSGGYYNSSPAGPYGYGGSGYGPAAPGYGYGGPAYGFPPGYGYGAPGYGYPPGPGPHGPPHGPGPGGWNHGHGGTHHGGPSGNEHSD